MKYLFQLERTALHYAMGLPSVEELSNILIKAGAKRIMRDLVRNLFSSDRYQTQRFDENDPFLEFFRNHDNPPITS